LLSVLRGSRSFLKFGVFQLHDEINSLTKIFKLVVVEWWDRYLFAKFLRNISNICRPPGNIENIKFALQVGQSV